MRVLCDDIGRLLTLPLVDKGERKKKFVLAGDIGVTTGCAYVATTNLDEAEIHCKMVQEYQKILSKTDFDTISKKAIDLLRTINSGWFACALKKNYELDIKDGVALSATFTVSNIVIRGKKNNYQSSKVISFVDTPEWQKRPLRTVENEPNAKTHYSCPKEMVSIRTVRNAMRSLTLNYRMQKTIQEIKKQEDKIRKILRG